MRRMLIHHVESEPRGGGNRVVGRKVVIGGSIVLGALALSGGAFAASNAGWIQLPCAVTNCQPEYGRVPDWPVNEFGETYGVQGDSPVSPDLIRVSASNGATGYVRSKDLNGPTPTSPEQAMEWQEANKGKSREIPVYKEDGRTVIGSFRIG